MDGTLRTATRGVLLAVAVLSAGVACTSHPRQPPEKNSGGVAAAPTAKRSVAKSHAPMRRASTREVAGRNVNERKNSQLERTASTGKPDSEIARSRPSIAANVEPAVSPQVAQGSTAQPDDSENASSGQSAPVNVEPRGGQPGWGWLGLLGLLGLAGLRRSYEPQKRLQLRVPRSAGALADRRVRVYDVEVQPSLKAPR